jgi:hypothetical protein
VGGQSGVYALTGGWYGPRASNDMARGQSQAVMAMVVAGDRVEKKLHKSPG